MTFRSTTTLARVSLGTVLGVPVYVHGSFILLAGGLSFGFWTRLELVLTAIFIAMLFRLDPDA